MRRLDTLAADSATLQAYLQEIAKLPRLAADQEHELGRRIRQGRDQDALHALVEGNLRFVVSYARRYRTLGVPLLDLIQEGNLGLLEAARHFDPTHGAKFVAHGAWWVRQAIMHRLVEAQASALRAQVEHRPAAENLEELDLTDDDARDVATRITLGTLGRAARERESHDAHFSDALYDQAIREIDDEPTRDALVRQLEAALDELDPQERLVMRLRYGLQDDEIWSLPRIAERLRISGGRVRHIEARATQTLRRLQHVRASLN